MALVAAVSNTWVVAVSYMSMVIIPFEFVRIRKR